MNELMESEAGLPVPSATTAVMDVEKSRAVQEVQISIMSAKRFPRDEVRAEAKIMVACQRYSLAEEAIYAYPRGGEKIEGVTIRLAEAIAQAWGNLEYGFQVLEQDQDRTSVGTFCWDLETNTRAKRTFIIEHRMKLKNGSMKILSDPRDIYEHIANHAQRRVRACILEIIPGDVVEKAKLACKKTLQIGKDSEPLIDRVKRIIRGLVALGITQELVEKKLGHPVDQCNGEEVADLIQVFNSIRDKHSRREDWFDLAVPVGSGKAADLNAKFARPVEKDNPPPSEPGGDFESFKG